MVEMTLLRTTLRQLREAKAALQEIQETLEAMDCTFFACPGPDAPFVDMATCSRCYILQKTRQTIKKLQPKKGN
jgi:hypothetical protein